MEKYFRYFKIPFIVTGVIVAICVGIKMANSTSMVRSNNETDLKNNVFDYADNLTADREAQLEATITEIEEQTGIDIAVVILNESLEGKGYEAGLSGRGTYDMWVKGYADSFADDHKMGYDYACGSNLVFVDNCFREPSTGRVDSWISTSGKAKENISTSECEEIMDIALANLTDYSGQEDYYKAYSKVVELVPRYASSTSAAVNLMQPKYIVVVSFLAALIYVLVNWRSKAGKKTTSGTTYVSQGRPNITRKQDIFLRKSVSKVRIQSSSGGGGGGGHSGGGGGHGGGGHSR